MKRKLLFIDVETGGRDADVHAICSIGAVVLNEGFIDETYSALVKDLSGKVTPEAFQVHGITDEEIAADGKTPGQVVEDLEQMFLRHDMRLPRRVVVGAHNADFDIAFFKRLYRLACAEYDVRYERRYMDTQALAYAMEQAGQFELYGPPTLENVCKAAGVPLQRSTQYHDAGEDAIGAARAWSRMVQMIRAR